MCKKCVRTPPDRGRSPCQDYYNRITLPNGYVVSITCQHNSGRASSPGAIVGLFDVGAWTVYDEKWVDGPHGDMTFRQVGDYLEEWSAKPNIPTVWQHGDAE